MFPSFFAFYMGGRAAALILLKSRADAGLANLWRELRRIDLSQGA